MVLILRAYTDVASLVLFDPAEAPEEFNAYEKEGGELLQSLDEAGKICWMRKTTNGSYRLHVYLEREIPEYLTQFVKLPPRIYEAFPIPSGQLVFSGAEYFSSEIPVKGISMPFFGEGLNLPAGTYRLNRSEADYPAGMIDELLRQRATTTQFRIHCLCNKLDSVGCGLVLLCILVLSVILGIILKSSAWTLIGFLITWIPLLVLFILGRSPANWAAEQIVERLTEIHPTHLISLSRVQEMEH